MGGLYSRTQWWIVASLAASGCAFTIDANVIKSERDAGSEDASIEDGAADSEPLDDAETPDDVNVEPDAVEPGPDDGDASRDGCQEDGCPPSCTADADCAEGYCSVQLGACQPPCSEAGCAGPKTSATHMISDGATVYWTTRSTSDDVLGNPVSDAAIWSWNLRDAPKQLVGGLTHTELLFVLDGFVYYLDFQRDVEQRKLWRAPLAGPQAPELLGERVQAAWNSTRFVYWSSRTEPSAELWRLSRDGAGSAERLGAGSHGGWRGGNDDFAYRIEQRGSDPAYYYLIGDRLPDLGLSRDVLGPDQDNFEFYRLLVVDSILYLVGLPATFRVDLDQPEGKELVTPANTDHTSIALQEGWLYWCTMMWNSGSVGLIYGRTQSDLLQPAAQLLQRRTPATMNVSSSAYTEFAVAGEQLVYWDHYEGRLFTFALPPVPCSVSSPCRMGKSCSAAMLCE